MENKSNATAGSELNTIRAFPEDLPQPSDQERLYQPLDTTKNEFRLLNILPIGDVDGQVDGIRCTSFVVSLDNPPPYQALSYCWGDQSSPGEVLLDGHLFRVGSNLEDALLHIRTHSIEIFWIDAICIDQNNDVEKGDQVGKMRIIYERAENVVIWLGPSAPNTASAFGLISDFYVNRSDSEYIADCLQREFDSLEGIIDLFFREYWDRIWVVQEVFSAKEFHIHCGKYRIEGRKVKMVQEILWLDHKELIRTKSRQQLLSLLPGSVLYGGIKALELPPCEPSSSLPDLYTTLSRFEFKRATDMRDRVYALVGVTTIRDDSRLVIDYSITVRQVYINYIKYVVTSTQKLDVICSLPCGDNDLNLPSWVPDQDVAHSYDEYGISLASKMRMQGPMYCSAKASMAEAAFKHDSEVLIANGVRLGRIQLAGQSGNWKHSNKPQGFHVGIPVLLSWYRMFAFRKGSGPEQIEEFFRTLLHDRINSEDVTNNSRFWEKALAAIVMLAKEYCPEERIDPHLSALGAEFQIEESWANFWIENTCNVIRCRRFFISDSDLIGLFPQKGTERDILCTLLGCSVPVLLRPHDGYYTLIGEAYIHGYMYGNAMDKLAEGKLRLEAFEIH